MSLHMNEQCVIDAFGSVGGNEKKIQTMKENFPRRDLKQSFHLME